MAARRSTAQHTGEPSSQRSGPRRVAPCRKDFVELVTRGARLAEAGYPDGIDPATGKPLRLTFDALDPTTARLLQFQFIANAWSRIVSAGRRNLRPRLSQRLSGSRSRFASLVRLLRR